MILSVGLIYTGPSADMISLLFTDNNIAPIELYGLITYVWVAPALIAGIYIGAELLNPEKKKYFLVVYIILGIVFELFLFLDTANTFTFTIPGVGSGDLIDSQFQLLSPTFLLAAAFLISIFILNGIGFLREARKQEGKIKKRFYFLSATFILFTFFGSFDAFVPVGAGLIIIRLGMIIITITLYYGVKPT